MSKDVFQFVPMQKLNYKWSDSELYSKYKLTKNEIEFIDKTIKERN